MRNLLLILIIPVLGACTTAQQQVSPHEPPEDQKEQSAENEQLNFVTHTALTFVRLGLGL